MNRDKLLKLLQEETDGFTEQSRLRDDVLDTLEKVQELAINYTRCCETLNVSKLMCFDEWLVTNKYREYEDCYFLGMQPFEEPELIKKYIIEMINL